MTCTRICCCYVCFLLLLFCRPDITALVAGLGVKHQFIYLLSYFLPSFFCRTCVLEKSLLLGVVKWAEEWTLNKLLKHASLQTIRPRPGSGVFTRTWSEEMRRAVKKNKCNFHGWEEEKQTLKALVNTALELRVTVKVLCSRACTVTALSCAVGKNRANRPRALLCWNNQNVV